MKPDCIFTADIHLREDQPICRLDNFWNTQERKITWLRGLQKKYGCPIVDAGDLTHKWKVSQYLARWCILNLPEEMITLWGNHNMPYHNMELYEKSILGVLDAARTVDVLFDDHYELTPNINITPFLYGVQPTGLEDRYGLRNIALMHIMTWAGRKPWPGCEHPGALTLLKQMKGFDIVVTGHNHKSFVVEHEGRLLVNPGSLTRQTADQADFKPRVYLWYAKDNHVEPIYVPIEEGVVSRDHIDDEKERDGRIDAYVSRLSGDFEVSLSFEKNLEEFFSKNRIRRGVKDIIKIAMNGE